MASIATIEVTSWSDPAGGTAWDGRARSELRKRLRSGLDLPLHEIRRLIRQIQARQPVSLNAIRVGDVLSVSQILTAMGAELDVTLESYNDGRLFKKWPKRGV